MVALIVAVIVGANIGIPQLVVTATASTAQSDRSFESEEDGFRLQVPAGWVIEDHDTIPFFEPSGAASAASAGEQMAVMCLENEALPGLGGEYNCQAGALTDIIFINRYPDLQSLPEFEDDTAQPTTNDLLALWIQYLQNNTSGIQIVNNTDVDEFTKIVNMTYTFYNPGSILPFDEASNDVKTRLLFVLSQDRNIGYEIVNSIGINNQTSPAVQEVFNSFELVQ
jgi:hypothetical protein